MLFRSLDDYLAEHGGSNLTQRRGEAESQSGVRDSFGYGLPEEEVVRILRPIAAALDYAHGEGVIHRDVKPANVMIRKDGHPFICAGCGYGTSLRNAGSYWSSVPDSDGNYAWDLYFDSSYHYAYSRYYRYCGRSVRPVQGVTK